MAKFTGKNKPNIQFSDIYEDGQGYEESFGPGRTQIKRRCLVPWQQRHDFVRGMVGWSYIGKNPAPLSAASIIRRYPPDKHPDAGQNGNGGLADNIYAVSCEMKDAIGTPDNFGLSNLIDYAASGQCIMEVTYEPLPYAVKDDEDVTATAYELERFVTRRISHTVESLQLPSHTYHFITNLNLIEQPIPKLVAGMELSYLWHDIPADLDNTGEFTLPGNLGTSIRAVVGATNNATFDNVWAAKTLLCLPPDLERTFNAGGHPSFNITYKFLYRENGWHKLYNPKSTVLAYEEVVAADNSTNVYSTADFTTLFKTV